MTPDSPILKLLPFAKNFCSLDELPAQETIVFLPGCNDRCIGVEYLIYQLQLQTNANVFCVEYSYLIES